MKLTESEVRTQLARVLRQKRSAKTNYETELKGIEFSEKRIQAQCPHTETHEQYGYELPHRTVCDICGADVE